MRLRNLKLKFYKYIAEIWADDYGIDGVDGIKKCIELVAEGNRQKTNRWRVRSQ